MPRCGYTVVPFRDASTRRARLRSGCVDSLGRELYCFPPSPRCGASGCVRETRISCRRKLLKWQRMRISAVGPDNDRRDNSLAAHGLEGRPRPTCSADLEAEHLPTPGLSAAPFESALVFLLEVNTICCGQHSDHTEPCDAQNAETLRTR
jgi:hypothetical protein